MATNLKAPTLPASVNEYAELKRLVKQKGLLDKQPIYYTYKIVLTIGLLALGLTLLVVVNNFWLLLLNAVYLAFVFTQIGFLVHDCQHHQIFHSIRKADMLSLVLANLLCGISCSWWADRHNRHHGHPNQFNLDPDTDTPFFSLSEEDARRKPKFLQSIVKYQAYLFLPLQFLAAVALEVWSIKFVLQNKAKFSLVEGLLLILHYVLYFGLLLLFSRLNIWQVVLFITVHQAFFGLYLGTVFAPNHKGMLVPDKDSPMDFLHQQVLTSRNVKATPLTDYWYGGGNYQIEHHLFPTMPRNKFKEAQCIVREYCKEHSIAYYETSVLQSYKEILYCMHQASASLREEKS